MATSPRHRLPALCCIESAIQEIEMADDLSQRGGQDRERVNVNQDHELRSWAQKFGVTRERVREAVQAVGDRADKVEDYLRGRNERSAG
jgi:Protein of unknown function (DUF3606)